MDVKEALKKTRARDVVRHCKPQTISFADDGITPNNSTLPFIYYQGAVDLTGANDPAAVFEELFRLNGWDRSWRNGVYEFLHYHSRIHEVLGIARGKAQVRFGGGNGKVVAIHADDVAILPAGTGHQLITASPDFLVVGAYPPQGIYDLCRGSAAEHAQALASIPMVPIPASDPLYGKDGGLTEIW